MHVIGDENASHWKVTRLKGENDKTTALHWKMFHKSFHMLATFNLFNKYTDIHKQTQKNPQPVWEFFAGHHSLSFLLLLTSYFVWGTKWLWE